MRKPIRLFSVVSVLIIMFCFAGCSMFGSSITKGKVSVVSGGVTFDAVALDDYSVESAIASSVSIPYNSDMLIQLEGTSYGEVYYSLYDSDGSECYSNKTQLEIPEREGVYHCIVSLNWGDETKSSAKSYIFSISRKAG